jgi:DNA-binding NtrC family response regulator
MNLTASGREEPWLPCGHRQATTRPPDKLAFERRPAHRHDVPVLIADDEQRDLRRMQHHLESEGYRVRTARDGREAMRRITPGLAIALFGTGLQEISGLKCLAHSQHHYPDLPVILISPVAEVADAVLAMKMGAVDYLIKPVAPEALVGRVREAILGRTAAAPDDDRAVCRAARCSAAPVCQFQFVGDCPPMRMLLHRIRRVAELDSTILITGASGTGKSTIAQMIHKSGPRSGGPFVSVNCSSLPRDLMEAELFGHAVGAFTGAVSDRPGRAEMADKGTLFLDEIGDLPLELQPKLLTFLQDRTFHRIGSNAVRKVDTRVIAATHQDLMAMCRQNRFRADLLYRLNVLPLHVPALDERREDIPGLAAYVLDSIARRRGIGGFDLAPEASASLQAYSWPGNVRELENCLEQATAFCEGRTIAAADLRLGISLLRQGDGPVQLARDDGPLNPPKSFSLDGLTLREIERQAVTAALISCQGNKAKAARQLGVSEKTIHNMVRRLKLAQPEAGRNGSVEGAHGT